MKRCALTVWVHRTFSFRNSGIQETDSGWPRAHSAVDEFFQVCLEAVPVSVTRTHCVQTSWIDLRLDTIKRWEKNLSVVSEVRASFSFFGGRPIFENSGLLSYCLHLRVFFWHFVLLQSGCFLIMAGFWCVDGAPAETSSDRSSRNLWKATDAPLWRVSLRAAPWQIHLSRHCMHPLKEVDVFGEHFPRLWSLLARKSSPDWEKRDLVMLVGRLQDARIQLERT